MDVTIPPHNLRRFTASLTCLAKIGKDLYLSFDPFDGLTLSSLNEAKSAYAKFHFECGFFERCLGQVGRPAGRREDAREEGSQEEVEWRYVCRVPVRSVHSVLRQRKGVLSLRIRSEGMDETGEHFGVNRRGSNKSEFRKDGEKVPYSSRRRKRKSREVQQQQEANQKMMLTFQYQIERPSKLTQPSNAPITSSFSVLHKIAVTDAHGITLSTSTHRKTRSEIIAPPKLWMRLLDPLKRTNEVALTIDDELKVVTATSFHNSEENAVLNRNAMLKTETSTGVEEFDEYDFRNNRKENDEELPGEVNERVVLVFSIKEAKVSMAVNCCFKTCSLMCLLTSVCFAIEKAMLQFCAQTNSTHHNDGEALSILSFHWGGRPIVIETDGDYFSAELVLATLHHGMIASNIVGREAGERG